MKKPMKKPVKRYADGGPVSNDPQAKKKNIRIGFFGTTEDNAIKMAEYKRGMGINPLAKRLSNAEASRSYRSMDNPTSSPYKAGDMKGVAKKTYPGSSQDAYAKQTKATEAALMDRFKKKTPSAPTPKAKPASPAKAASKSTPPKPTIRPSAPKSEDTFQRAVRGADAGSDYLRNKLRPKKSLFGK